VEREEVRESISSFSATPTCVEGEKNHGDSAGTCSRGESFEEASGLARNSLEQRVSAQLRECEKEGIAGMGTL